MNVKREAVVGMTLSMVFTGVSTQVYCIFHLKPAGSRVLITVKNSALCAVFPVYIKLEISQFGSGD